MSGDSTIEAWGLTFEPIEITCNGPSPRFWPVHADPYSGKPEDLSVGVYAHDGLVLARADFQDGHRFILFEPNGRFGPWGDKENPANLEGFEEWVFAVEVDSVRYISDPVEVQG